MLPAVVGSSCSPAVKLELVLSALAVLPPDTPRVSLNAACCHRCTTHGAARRSGWLRGLVVSRNDRRSPVWHMCVVDTGRIMGDLLPVAAQAVTGVLSCWSLHVAIKSVSS